MQEELAVGCYTIRGGLKLSKIIGIDLGTTNSCVSILEGGAPKIITNAEGNRTTPSVVAFKDGERLIGEAAKRQALTNLETVFSIKSKMGYSQKIKLGEKDYTPQEISAMIIQSLKTQAEEYLGEPVTKAVITVPAYFNDAQRQATKDAGKIAGLKVERIINEPTAAALAYGLDKLEGTQTILVYDFGGGTFDVSVLELDNGLFEVKSTSGDNKLGGDNFDNRIVDHLIAEFRNDTGVDLTFDKVANNRIREAAEKAKKDLSSLKSTEITLPFLSMSSERVLHLETVLTRAKFDELTSDLVQATKTPIQQALRDAGLESRELDKVILVGGTTRIPAVVNMVKQLTGQEPHKGVNPDEVVAMGAAIQGGVLSGEVQDLVLIDVTPLSLGIQTAGGIFTTIIPRNTSIPTSQAKTFSTAVDNQSTVDIHVLQGERSMASDNKSLGHFLLNDILPAPSGVPQIEVTFSIDKNGIVSVNARDTRIGRNQTIIIESRHGLDESDIARMVKEAELHAQADKAKAHKVTLLNDAYNLVVQARQTLTQMETEITEEEKANVLKLCEIVDSYTQLDDIEQLPDNMEQLEVALNVLFIKNYQKTADDKNSSQE